jgi:glycerol-3-phosphate cytidylyltransferase
MIYCFDLDGTICTSVKNSQYEFAMPDPEMIFRINNLYDLGHTIKIMTARGCVSGIDHAELTQKQLSEWGVKHHELIMNKKPEADYFIDDKAMNVYDWKRGKIFDRGVVAGAFDLIHPGYIKMFKEAKEYCNHLTVLLHADPSLENGKPRPVQFLRDRIEILQEMRSVDSVIPYNTEQGLYEQLKYGDYDVRFLGSDYKNKPYTGPDLNMSIFFIERNHNYSTTALKLKIKESM